MTIDQKISRAYSVTLLASISFGIWMHSFFAGFFMGCVVLLFGGLVVAVQHYCSGGYKRGE